MNNSKKNTIDNMSINIIIDETDPQNPIFVEIENDSRMSINIGKRTKINDDFTSIRISVIDIVDHVNIK